MKYSDEEILEIIRILAFYSYDIKGKDSDLVQLGYRFMSNPNSCPDRLYDEVNAIMHSPGCCTEMRYKWYTSEEREALYQKTIDLINEVFG